MNIVKAMYAESVVAGALCNKYRPTELDIATAEVASATNCFSQGTNFQCFSLIEHLCW